MNAASSWGLYTVAVTNGPHVAPIAGGYIAQRLGWRWCFWIPAFIQSSLCIVVFITFPESLFSRVDQNRLAGQSLAKRLFFHGKILDRKVRLRDFMLSLRMVKYAAVTLPALWYCTANTYGSALFAVTGSAIGKKVFKFDVEQTGLWVGIPSTIGCFIGEMSAGWVSDVMSNADARRRDGHHKPEARLYLLPGCTLLAIGTATFGYCVQPHKPWIQAAVCLAVSGFGTQFGTTIVYLYTTDCYKAQGPEIGVVINLFTSVFAFNIGFYGLRFSENVGFDSAFAIFAAINAALELPLVVLLFRGEQIRMKQGNPKDHQDL
ncbi:hypothetical protein LTR96_011072 [Exophiala xenobiotica]|nr:hypothetical protein LTR41_011166 [Exophiala xenobiotica]KAK5215801.1 hypothetical protein LTR72_011157 [Exophiala xenobiotica]KAK5220837.1 hypothetical protein LTR47_011096 [Exophiala xenobiotica]KAK5245646.1 hypothetical protein LTS06_008947 [Exophiala xenobiotica]KAK5263540.1 hypothetical protein LTR96_011072 [Exophiala xenobiotica]